MPRVSLFLLALFLVSTTAQCSIEDVLSEGIKYRAADQSFSGDLALDDDGETVTEHQRGNGCTLTITSTLMASNVTFVLTVLDCQTSQLCTSFCPAEGEVLDGEINFNDNCDSGTLTISSQTLTWSSEAGRLTASMPLSFVIIYLLCISLM